MADYRKMYTTLLCAIDEVIDPLRRSSQGGYYADVLQAALERAEEIFIETSEGGV